MASISDNFNVSDNAALSGQLTWTEFQGTGWATVSNRASVTSTSQHEARADTTLSGANQRVSATIVSATADAGGTVRCVPMGRKDNSATRTFYVFWFNMVNNAYTQYETAKRVSGSLSSIATNATDPVAGEVMRLEVDGSNIIGYVNGVLRVGPTTDESIASNTYTWLGYSSNNPTTFNSVLDTFAAEDTAAPSSFSPWRRWRG